MKGASKLTGTIPTEFGFMLKLNDLSLGEFDVAN